MFYLAYINVILLASPKRVPSGNCEIKIEKVPPPARSQLQSIPLNATRNGRELGWQCPIFERTLPAHHARLIGFPFWECAASPTHAWVHPFASRLGATQLTRALALIGMYYTNIHLGYETLFGSPGAVPGTLSSRVGGVGINPLATHATGEHWFRSSIRLLC